MTDVLIFGGTAEGRELAACAARLGLSVLVSVVSEYGRELAAEEPLPDLRVRCGALDGAGMEELFGAERPALVIDATHPHAAEATRQITAACARAGLARLRVVRDGAGPAAEGLQDACAAARPQNAEVFVVRTAKEAARLLCADSAPVLLTTGSKELAVFAGEPCLEGRLYARVLPDAEVLAACARLGVRGRHLIAMQGPFSEEMNCALLRHVGAGWLVTKESGARGGFAEKLAAARACGVKAVVIGRPAEDAKGVGMEAAKRRLEELASGRRGQMRRLSLIGLGMGDGRQLTLEALEALRAAQAMFGAPRMLADVGRWTEGKQTEQIYRGREILDWLEHHPQCRNACVVYSGDTGFYSGSRQLLELFAGRQDWQVQVYPGISTVAALCARLHRPWENLQLASVHGRACEVERLLAEHEAVFLLLGGEYPLGALCRRLCAAGMGQTKVQAGISLGYPQEQILTGTAADFADREADALVAVILEREGQTDA